MNWLKRRVASFRYAFKGLALFLSTESHAQLHVLAATLVLLAAYVTGLERWEWVAIILAIALVIMAEAMNTALEALANAVHPDHHPLIGKAKDIAASSVLITAFGAAIIGVIIFMPHCIPLSSRI